MESGEVDTYNLLPALPNPLVCFTKLLSLQAEIFTTVVFSLASPFFSLISAAADLFRPPRQDIPPTPVSSAGEEEEEPSSCRGGGGLLLGRIAMGLVAAAYVCMVLMMVMTVAAAVGFGLVRAWVEEPIYAAESLQFDYTVAHPTAVFAFRCRAAAVPVGQTLYVSLVLLMPESDYNRDIGIFQLTAELISSDGDLVAKSSHPCMLRFKSWPIRLIRTFLVAMPLLLGLTTETQRLSFPILKHKETTFPRTSLVRITLIPRAGTLALPQFYEAEVLIKSRLPFLKGLVYRWKWTFCIWTTLYIFVILVMFLLFFLKPVILPIMTSSYAKGEHDSSTVELVSQEAVASGREREVSESLRRWQRSRSKRKAVLLRGVMPDNEEGESACSISGVSFEEGSGDSESVCFRGVG